jgi:hypothetical protein
MSHFQRLDGLVHGVYWTLVPNSLDLDELSFPRYPSHQADERDGRMNKKAMKKKEKTVTR